MNEPDYLGGFVVQKSMPELLRTLGGPAATDLLFIGDRGDTLGLTVSPVMLVVLTLAIQRAVHERDFASRDFAAVAEAMGRHFTAILAKEAPRLAGAMEAGWPQTNEGGAR